MPRLKTKSGEASQVKPSTKITIAFPDVFLGWCDEMAGVRHLERNDVIRQAIGFGLVVFQAENLRLSGHDGEAGVKSAPGSLVKPSTKITIALPNELLEWAAVMATVRGLERNDVMRQAAVLGLMGMLAEHMRLSGRGEEADAWFAAQGAGPEVMQRYAERVGGIEGFKERIRAGVRADAEKVSKQA